MINAANAQHGKKYDDWIEITGLSYQTLRGICYVAENIPLLRRRNKLDFSAHREIAPIKDETKREKILDLAEKRAFTLRGLANPKPQFSRWREIGNFAATRKTRLL